MTFEIKKSIDLSKMKLPVQQSSSYPASLAPKTYNNANSNN